MKKTISISLIASALLFGANSDVTTLTTDYENTIQGASTIDASTVNQGKTDVTGSTVLNVDLLKNTTGNMIDNVDIEGGSTVNQARFIITDSNASSSTANGISIKSANTIQNSEIRDASNVKQTYTEITGGSTVQALNLEYTNIIEDVSSDSSEINASTISQGILIVNGASEVTDFTQLTIRNTMQDVDANDANLTQNSIIVTNGSTVTDFDNEDGATSPDATNSMINVTATNGAKISQNTNTFDNSTIDGLRTKQANSIENLTLDTNSIVQGNIEVTGSEVKDFDVEFTNKISDVTITGAGTTEQGVLIVTDSNGTGDADADTLDIKAVNTLVNTDLDTSNIVQSKTSLIGSTGRAIVSGLTLDHTNTIQNSDASDATIRDNNATRATISQAETTITDSTVTGMTQTFVNLVQQAEIADSTLSQGQTVITNSDVTALTMTQTNTVANSSIKNSSTVTQGSTTILGN
jgi:hypothetical protein